MADGSRYRVDLTISLRIMGHIICTADDAGQAKKQVLELMRREAAFLPHSDLTPETYNLGFVDDDDQVLVEEDMYVEEYHD